MQHCSGHVGCRTARQCTSAPVLRKAFCHIHQRKPHCLSMVRVYAAAPDQEIGDEAQGKCERAPWSLHRTRQNTSQVAAGWSVCLLLPDKVNDMVKLECLPHSSRGQAD